MNPTDTLIGEHRLIEQVLNCLERMAEGCGKDGNLDTLLAEDTIGFLQAFVHRWHFPREEACLAFCTAGECRRRADQHPRFHDHQRLGFHLDSMAAAVEQIAAGHRESVAGFVQHAEAYVAVSMEHIEDEEDRVFPAFQRTLTEHLSLEAASAIVRATPEAADLAQMERWIETANRLADHFQVARCY